YYIFSGSPPHGRGTAPELLERAMKHRVPPIADARPDLPAAVKSLVDRAVEPDLTKRFPDARAMRSEVEGALRACGEGGRDDLARLLRELPLPDDKDNDIVSDTISDQESTSHLTANEKSSSAQTEQAGKAEETVQGGPRRDVVEQVPQRGA